MVMPRVKDGVRSNRLLNALLERNVETMPNPCMVRVTATSITPQPISSNEVR